MLTLSSAAIIEKNKIASTGVWLILLEVQITDQIILHLAYNTEHVNWNGRVWEPFNFTLDAIKEDGEEMPAVKLAISNVTKAAQGYVEAYDGLIKRPVALRIVHSEHLDLTIPEVEETFVITATDVTNEWITFTLGADMPMQSRFPPRRVLKNFCPYKYKGIECGATSALAECNRTLTACRERNNAGRFGGEPSIPQGGIYV